MPRKALRDNNNECRHCDVESPFDGMTEDQRQCFQMLCDLFGGDHHVAQRGKVKPWGRGIMINAKLDEAATFDRDLLTRAVILAHDRMIRFAVSPCTPNRLQLTLFRRQRREGRFSERHPMIENAVNRMRRKHPVSQRHRINTV